MLKCGKCFCTCDLSCRGVKLKKYKETLSVVLQIRTWQIFIVAMGLSMKAWIFFKSRVRLLQRNNEICGKLNLNMAALRIVKLKVVYFEILEMSLSQVCNLRFKSE